MGRTKKIIASLLPAFWLVALVHGPLECSACAWPYHECATSSSTEGAAPLPDQSGCAIDQSARYELRRQVVERPPVAPRHLELAACDNSISVRRLTSAILQAGDAFLLQQRWQFVWRTADSPRAPSFLA